jgi:glycosyltransferase involved in cell wall biosynthesis
MKIPPLLNKRSHFAAGVLTPTLTKGDVQPPLETPFNGSTLESAWSTTNSHRQAKPMHLVFLGRLDPKKGIENLIHACALLKRMGQLQFSLTIAGAGNPLYTQSLQSKIVALDLAGEVDMIGAVCGKAKKNLFGGAAIVVVPSHTENFALVVAEALAHGVPVIASKGTPWQKLEENGCGLWVDNDAANLADAIGRMAHMPLTEMGRRGRDWMAREFSWQERAAEMTQLYQSSLHGAPYKRSHFAAGVLTPALTKGDARPLWKPHLKVPRRNRRGQEQI